MRVLYVAGYDHPAYHHKVELLADAPDVEILHVTVAGYGKEPGRYPSANGQHTYRVRTFPAFWLGRAGDPHRGFLWPPHYGMGEFQPDVIHTESDVETLGTAQVALARRILARRAKLIEYSWQNIQRPRRLAVRLLSRLTLQAADHVVCASAEAAEVLRREGYRRDTTIMPLVGVDPRYFAPRPVPELRARLGLHGVVIGYVGRLVPNKGVDTLLQAAAQVPAHAELLILGDGAEKQSLQARAATLGITGRCHFVGAIEYDRVGDYMNAMDVLVLPSQTTAHWKEQFGRVLIEAMGCRVAVCGSDSGAIPEVIDDAGCIFPEGDADRLAGILGNLIDKPALRHELGERGYRRVQRHYTVEQLANQVLQVWRRVVRT